VVEREPDGARGGGGKVLAVAGAAWRPSANAILLAVLLGLSAIAWLVTSISEPAMRIGVLSGMGSMSVTGIRSHSMALGLFVGMWIVMMVAMMFPAVAPVVLIFDRWVQSRGRSRSSTVGFLVGYLTVWSLAGLGAYGVAVLAQMFLAPSVTAIRLGALVLMAAGFYQLSPLKQVCLAHCRSPMGFLMTHAAEFGTAPLGPFRVGLRHGAFCLGCCWGLMVILLLLGAMSLVWMGVIAVVILAEKLAPAGQRISQITGLAVALGGLFLAVLPRSVPVLP
jgi:predicted metal-binding membrane protein